MCLSIVYKNEINENNILMKNVLSIESKDNTLIFTDLMERHLSLKGQIKIANLVDGYVVVKVNDDE